MGGLGAGHAAATLAFLPFADGLVFVSDASAELSAPEVEFLRRATELCPTVLFAPDQDRPLPAVAADRRPRPRPPRAAGAAHPDGRRLERSAHRGAGAQGQGAQRAQPVPRARQPARRQGRRAGQGGRRRALGAATCRAIAQHGALGPRSRSAGPRRSGGDAGAVDRLEAAKQRLEHLRGPGARWSTLVSDRIADLSNNVMFDFRAGMRQISRDHGRGDRESHEGRRVGRHGPRPPGRRRRRGHPRVRRPRGGRRRSAPRWSSCSARRTSSSTSVPASA